MKRLISQSLIKLNCTTVITVVLVTILLNMTVCTFGQGQTRNWIGGSGSWSIPENWNPYGVPVPTSSSVTSESAQIDHSDGVTRTITYADPSGHSYWNVIVRNQSGTTTLIVAQDRLGAMATMRIDHAILRQDGGIVGRNNVTSIGNGAEYILNNGNSIGDVVQVGTYGGVGKFTQNGGAATANLQLSVGTSDGVSGNYYMRNGTLSAGDLAGGPDASISIKSGVFEHSGGTVTARTWYYASRLSGGLFVSSDGTYNLTGSSAVLEPKYVNNNGIINQSAGTFRLSGVSGYGGTMEMPTSQSQTGHFNLSGGSLDIEDDVILASQGVAFFLQTGGTHSIGRYLYVGKGTSNQNIQLKEATYTLNAGSLSATEEYIGYMERTSSTFNHINGTNTVNTLIVGTDPSVDPTTTGTYNFTNGSLNANAIVNWGTFNCFGGNLTLGAGGLTNNGSLTISGPGGGSRTTIGDIINNNSLYFQGTSLTIVGGLVQNGGIIKSTGSTIFWTGNATISAGYISDPSIQGFSDLLVKPNGYLQGGVGDVFSVSRDLTVQSVSTDWNTTHAKLVFSGSAIHHMTVPPYSNPENFSWGEIEVKSGEQLIVAGDELKLGTLTIGNGSTLTLDGIVVQSESVDNQGGQIMEINGGKLISGSLPDLIIESLTHSPRSPKKSQNITFTAVVKNIGGAPSGTFNLTLKVGGETNGENYTIPNLGPGESFTVQRQEILNVEQNYRNTATADSNNDVAESNENNNQKIDNYRVPSLSYIGIIILLVLIILADSLHRRVLSTKK